MTEIKDHVLMLGQEWAVAAEPLTLQFHTTQNEITQA